MPTIEPQSNTLIVPVGVAVGRQLRQRDVAARHTLALAGLVEAVIG